MTDLETDDLHQLSKQKLQDDTGDQVDLSDETQDFRFLEVFARGGVSGSKKTDATIPKRGEKDFAPDGTDLQSRILAESRLAMHNALSGTRTHTNKTNLHLIWHPECGQAEVKVAKGMHFKSMGQADKAGVVWLQREEVVYLVERGGVECWWEEGIPMSLQGCYAECLGAAGDGAVERYQVYAYLRRSGYIVKRAETFAPTSTSPPQSSTYTTDSIRTTRSSANVATRWLTPTYHSPGSLPPTGLISSLYHRLFWPLLHPQLSPTGPLIPPHIPLRSISQIYSRLSLIPCHHPSLSPQPAQLPTQLYSVTHPSYKVTYSVWKPQPHFKKSDPGPPDFRVCVVSTAEQREVLTLTDVEDLLSSVPMEYPQQPQLTAISKALAWGQNTPASPDPPSPATGKKKKPTSTWESKSLYQRLKDGRKGVILAIVDAGVISFIRIGDVGFGEEKLWELGQPRKKGGNQRGGSQKSGAVGSVSDAGKGKGKAAAAGDGRSKVVRP